MNRAEDIRNKRNPGPLASNWLNIENKIGYILVHPERNVSFSHGKHAKPKNGECRISVVWPHASQAKYICTVMVCNQSANETQALARKKEHRGIPTQQPDLQAAWIPGRDGTGYLLTFNTGEKAAALSYPLPAQGRSFAKILGLDCQLNGRTLSLETAPGSVGLVQVSAGQSPKKARPQVRLIAPSLKTVFRKPLG